MTDETEFAYLAQLHALGDDPIPPIVLEIAGHDEPELVWRNELGGLTFRIGDRFVKWNPRRTGIDLQRERERLDWISRRHPAPRVLAYGASEDAQWLVTAALPGVCAVGDEWRARPTQAAHWWDNPPILAGRDLEAGGRCLLRERARVPES